MIRNGNDFCRCEDITSVHIEEDGFGYWHVCDTCNKRLEDGFHEYDETSIEYHET